MQDLGIAVEKLNSCLGSKKTKADTLEQDEIELLQLGKLFECSILFSSLKPSFSPRPKPWLPVPLPLRFFRYASISVYVSGGGNLHKFGFI